MVGACSNPTSIDACPLTGWSLPRKPIIANVSTASEGATSAYRPCWSVTVCVCVPFTRTVTPHNFSPVVADVTVPEIGVPCAGALVVTTTRKTTAIPYTTCLARQDPQCGSPDQATPYDYRRLL